MDWKRKLAGAALALGMATAGIAATASPAAAVGGCPSGKLCLYADTDYTTLTLTSTSTHVCIYLENYGHDGFYDGIPSYVNNLPFGVAVYYGYWAAADETYKLYGTISPGGYSSHTGDQMSAANPLFGGYYGAVCMGGVKP